MIRAEEFFSKLNNSHKNVCFLKSFSNQGWATLITWDPVEVYSYKSGQGKNRFKNFVHEQIVLSRKLIGYVSYDLGYELYNINKTTKDDLKLPDIYFLSFANYVLFNDNNYQIVGKDERFIQEVQNIINQPVIEFTDRGNNKNFVLDISRSQYGRGFKKIKKYIKAGDIYQVNYTHRLHGQTEWPAKKLFLRIIQTNQVDFLAYIQADNFEILSASPERFVKFKQGQIETCPVKGTRPRGQTLEQDLKLKNELLQSSKEAAELNMITDLLRNDLGKVCQIGTVKVVGNRIISPCPTVWHTFSKIVGQLRHNIHPVEALLSMLPGGSITGCPKKRALQIIDELEKYTRSIYTGIIGYIDPNLDMDFNIAIRTIIKKNKQLYLGVGGGVVDDSVEEAEYQETLAKAKSFMKLFS